MYIFPKCGQNFFIKLLKVHERTTQLKLSMKTKHKSTNCNHFPAKSYIIIKNSHWSHPNCSNVQSSEQIWSSMDKIAII